MDLQAPEIVLLLKACWKYRRSLPAYLQSAQPEIALLEEIIAKLEGALASDS